MDLMILEVFSNLNDSMMVKCWHRLPREEIDAPPLETFKAR